MRRVSKILSHIYLFLRGFLEGQGQIPKKNSLECFLFVFFFLLLTIMSKIVNLFTDSDKLDGVKNYKSWQRHMKNTLIYNELWRGICEGDPTSTKLTDATALAKWELQNEKELALIHSFVYDYLCIHIENTSLASTGWEQFKKKIDTPPISQRIDLHMNY